MDTVTTFLAGVLRPVLAPISRWLLKDERKRPTWHFEAIFVALVLFVVAVFTSPDIRLVASDGALLTQFLIVWLSACAVLGSFLHAKVGYRMAEALQESNASNTSCYEWSGKYWLTKELLWLIVFFLSGAYPAIAGAVLFILYPAWRKIHTEERHKLRGVR